MAVRQRLFGGTTRDYGRRGDSRVKVADGPGTDGQVQLLHLTLISSRITAEDHTHTRGGEIAVIFSSANYVVMTCTANEATKL